MVRRGERCRYQYDIRIERVWNGETIWEGFKLAEFHFITDDPWGEMESPVEITFKNRHTPDFTSGLLIKEGKSYSISSMEPVQGIAPGQFAVVYDKERHICVGSGVITL